jgi:hypothetical protein
MPVGVPERQEQRRIGRGSNFGTARVAHIDLRDFALHPG